MYRLILLADFVKNNLSRMLTLSFVYFLTLIMLCMMIGYYNYETRAMILLQNSSLSDADYFMRFVTDMTKTDTNELIQQLTEMDGVESVLYGYHEEVRGVRFNVSSSRLYPEDLINCETYDGESLDCNDDGISETASIFPNFYIIYENSSDQRSEKVRDFLEDKGYCVSIESIIENKNADFIRKIKSELSVPWILFGIVVYACVVITLMIQHDYAYEFAVYSICGAGKITLLKIFMGNMIIFIMPPCIFICLYVKNFDRIMIKSGIDYQNWLIYFTGKEMFLCVLLSLLLVMISVLTWAIYWYDQGPIRKYREGTL